MTKVALSGAKMSTSDEEQSVHRICDDPSKIWERWWTKVGELINPILVKEVRQSLKSRQFVLCFSLTLIAAVGWTFVAVAMLVPRIYYVPGGLQLLAGYFVILHVPLMVIIPFSAFRSLATETEDSTFELLSISTLSAKQIIRGKMVTSLLQVVLYLSALAPCIVLTYLLRGVGLFTILFILGWTVIFSVCLVTVGLLLASISRSRLTQSSVSVLFLVGLLVATISWTMAVVQPDFMLSMESAPAEIPMVMFGVVTFVFAAIVLAMQSAAAAIDFASENKSTPIRWRILLLSLVAYFWMSVVCAANKITIPWLPGLTAIAIGYAFFGGLMCGEIGIVSPRARRSLPKTFFSRALLTWLNPGSGMGYVFIIVTYAALVGTVGAQELYLSSRADFMKNGMNASVTLFGYALMCYLTCYVGITRLLMLAWGRFIPAPMVASAAILIVLIVMGHLIPLVTIFALNDYQNFPYAWHQCANFMWTIMEMVEDRNTDQIMFSLLLLTLASVVIFVLNLFSLTNEVMVVRVAAPARVQEETHKPAAPAIAIDPFRD